MNKEECTKKLKKCKIAHDYRHFASSAQGLKIFTGKHYNLCLSKQKTAHDFRWFASLLQNSKYFTEKDLTFNAKVEGVGAFYQHETNLLFNVTPTQNAFINIFLFNQTEAYQMFPNDYEKSYLLEKDKQYDFPSFRVNYELSTKKKSEPHRMIVVLTKEEIPYLGEVEYKQIIDWIF